ncbi:MAG: hypothetical protein I8H86_08705 [Sphingomonadaceae bacterium]|nr:hypothetical protein [Sphingomonadaceae bacterium]
MNNISDAQIDAIVDDLDESHPVRGSYWQMLKHAEFHGFDLAVLKPSIHSYILYLASDIPKPKNEDEERELVLKLRERMRVELNMPPLSEDERSEWCWNEPEGLRRHRYIGPKLIGNQPRLNGEQIRDIISYIHVKHPDVIRYMDAVRSHNALLGYNGGPNNHKIVRQYWHFSLLQDAICEVVGEESDLFILHFDIEEVLYPRTN